MQPTSGNQPKSEHQKIMDEMDFEQRDIISIHKLVSELEEAFQPHKLSELLHICLQPLIRRAQDVAKMKSTHIYTVSFEHRPVEDIDNWFKQQPDRFDLKLSGVFVQGDSGYGCEFPTFLALFITFKNA
jgi:hypothetical protein